jgi:hypothetical protein
MSTLASFRSSDLSVCVQTTQSGKPLAFRFVRWALAQGDPSVRERVVAATNPAFCVGAVARGVVAPCLTALLS